jgi:hypothetical protein
MPNQVLAEIVRVEKEIQARLAEERQKAAAWLESERARITAAVELELAESQREFRRTMAAAEAEVEIKIATLLKQAEEYAERLRKLPDQRLRKQLLLHLDRLLPEEQE